MPGFDARLPSLMLITDRAACLGRPLEAVLEAACAAGVCLVQLREAGLSDRELWEVATRAREVTRRVGALLIINDRLDLALAVGADGVHAKRTSLRPPAIRRLLPPGSLVGASCHTLDETREARREGADYLVFGPLFDTPSKRPYGPPVGLEALAQVCREGPTPVFGVGGITPERAPEVLATGAHGVAAIGALCGAPDIEAAVRAFGGSPRPL